MREILFRGKRVEDDEWVEGYYAKVEHWLDDHEMHIIIPQYTNVYPHCEFTSYDEIKPETIGLFTGFFDKNGKRIFEGDIVSLSFPDVRIIRSVIFDERYAEFEFNSKDPVENPDGVCLCCDYDVCEVIGNIHDNPELLEESK